jgi:hypothetical protein
MVVNPELPAAMVERAAQALHEHDQQRFFGDPWSELDEDARDSYRGDVRAVFAGALEGCEVRHEMGTRIGDGSIITLAEAGTRYTLFAEARRRRMIITTEWGMVPVEQIGDTQWAPGSAH